MGIGQEGQERWFLKKLHVKPDGCLTLVVQGEVESSMDRFVDEFIEQTVFTKNYLVRHL